MAVNRPVTREHEEVEFRPVPGQEHEWASFCDVQRSRLWDYIGVYPVGFALVAILLLIAEAL